MSDARELTCCCKMGFGESSCGHFMVDIAGALALQDIASGLCSSRFHFRRLLGRYYCRVHVAKVSLEPFQYCTSQY